MTVPNCGHIDEPSPCYECKDRIVINGHRCHSWCKRYAIWEEDQKRKKIAKAEYKKRHANNTEASDAYFKKKYHYNQIKNLNHI